MKDPLHNRKIVERDYLFDIDEVWVSSSPIKILCAHFSPFKNELEATDYPLFLTKMFPNGTIHATYDKGGSNFLSFELNGNEVSVLDDIDSSYDIIIGRSSVFNNMAARHNHKRALDNSGFKVNIKPMGLGGNKKYCDFWFDDGFLFCPPSPLYRKKVKEIIEDDNFKKKDFVLFSGKIGREKNQLDFVEKVDPVLCDNLTFVFVGNDTADPDYVQTLAKLCEQKNISYSIMGVVDFINQMPYYTAHSKLHVINCDPRPFGQPYDPIPRVLGECAISDTHTICSKTTLFNDDVSKYVTSYNHESSNSLNDVFAKSLDIDTLGYHYDLITMEEKCCDMTWRILKEAGSLS